MNTLTDTNSAQQAKEFYMEPIERVVYNPNNYDTHALGARLVYLIEENAELEEDVRNASLIPESEDMTSKQKRSLMARILVRSIEEPLDGIPSSRDRRAQIPLDVAEEELAIQRTQIKDELAHVKKQILDRRIKELSHSSRIQMDDLPPFLSTQYLEVLKKANEYISVEDWLVSDPQSDDTRNGDPDDDTPSFLNLDISDPQKLRNDMLTEKALVAHNADYKDERLVSFLKYYVNKREKLQKDPELNEAFDELKQDWLAAVDKGILEGWLHPNAVYAAKRMKQLTTVFADYYDLTANSCIAYAKPDNYLVVLPSNVDGIELAGSHELNHALLGHFGYFWLDEAITEHIAQVLEGNRVVNDIYSVGVLTGTNTAQDNEDDRFYRGERDLLAALIEASKGKLTITDFTLTYSNNTRQRGNDEAVENLYKKIDEAYGTVGTLYFLEQYMNHLIKQYHANGKELFEAKWQAYKKTAFILSTNPQEIFTQNKQKAKL